MDFEAKKLEVEKQIQQNKVDQMKYEQALQGLKRGADYLQGQLELIKNFIKEAETALATKASELANTVAKDVKAEVSALTGQDGSNEPTEPNKSN